jgi:hypothetical protein
MTGWCPRAFIQGPHVHVYERYPERRAEWCGWGDDCPVLEVGSSITTPDGRVWQALLGWQGNFLTVRRDRSGAQVATLRHTEPSAVQRELAAAGGASRG